MNGQQGQQKFNGYIVALPRRPGGEEEGARVALQTEAGVEYPILPKGMGLDLVEHINARVELTGVMQHRGELICLLVRDYTVTDDFEDNWYDDAP